MNLNIQTNADNFSVIIVISTKIIVAYNIPYDNVNQWTVNYIFPNTLVLILSDIKKKNTIKNAIYAIVLLLSLHPGVLVEVFSFWFDELGTKNQI